MPGAQGIMHLAMLAWRGRDTQAYAVADDIAREAKRRGAAAFVTKGTDFSVLLNALRFGSRPA